MSKRFRTFWAALALALVIDVGMLAAQGATGRITGTVTERGSTRPVPTAQVLIVGTQIGARVAPDGSFTLTNVPVGAQRLRVEAAGFTAGFFPMTVLAGEAVSVRAELAAAAVGLDALVVTGTAGASRRREIGNTISAVTTEQLAAAPVVDISESLQASVPGLSIVSSDGSAGAGSSIRLRGVKSISQGNRPLIYVDGVRMNSGTYSAGAGALSPGQASDALMDINPSDIERVEVIKGAAATTLYGTEAAGGVIQIFTKSGAGLANNSAIWTAEIQQGISQLPQLVTKEFESAAWYDRYGDESEEMWMRDWVRDAPSQSYDLSVRGRGGDVEYFVSGGWQEELGVVKTQGMTDWTLRGNLGFKPNDKMSIRFNNSFTARDIDWVLMGNAAESFTINVMRGPFGYGLEDKSRILDFDLDDRQSHFVTGLDFTYTPWESWVNKLTVGLDFMEQDYGTTEHFGGFFTPQGRRSLTRWENSTKTIDLASSINWAPFDNISTSTSIGFQAFSNNDVLLLGTAQNFAGPGSPTIDSGALRNASETRLSVVNAGVFGQEVIGFGEKLFLTLGLRADGNSSFGDDYGLQLYPKVSGSYVLSDESWWPGMVDLMKLRAAWGTSGKAPGYFDATRVWAPVSANEGLPGVVPQNLGNPNLGPERTSEREFGFEAGMFDSRVTVDATFYNQITDDALIAVPQDPSLGFLGTQLRNVGKLQNKGMEVALNVVPVRTDLIEWNVGTTLSTNKSEALDMGEAGDLYLGAFGANVANQWVREGYPVPSHFSVQLQNPDEIGKPVTLANQYMGPVYPTHTWFFNSSLDVGDLNLSARAEQSGGHFLQSATYHRQMQRGVWPACYDIQQQIAAGGIGTLTAQQRYTCNYAESPFPGAAISPADFFKLRSVSLGYSIPERFVPIGDSWRITVSGSNLFTSSDYIGLDPETSDGSTGEGGGDNFVRVEYYNLPPSRKYTVRLQTTF